MVPDANDKNPTGGVRGTRHRLRGPSRIDAPPASKKPASAQPTPSKARPDPLAPPNKSVPVKKRVLFVCIGNSCRSQMAEAFARAYGSDILDAESAGVSPATYIAPLTKQTLGERNLTIDDHFPKGLDHFRHQHFDVVINMSGVPVGLAGGRVIQWTVPDPIGHTESYYRGVATQIEGLVMRLIMELRNAPQAAAVQPKIVRPKI
jgi:arsenate reductase (thioredoxin)